MKLNIIIIALALSTASCNKESVIEGYTNTKLKAPIAINTGTALLTTGSTWVNYNIDGKNGRFQIFVSKSKATQAGSQFSVNDSLSYIQLINDNATGVYTTFIGTNQGIDKLAQGSIRKNYTSVANWGTVVFMGKRSTPYTAGWTVLQAIPPNYISSSMILPGGSNILSPQFTVNETAYINFETYTTNNPGAKFYGWIKVTTTTSRIDFVEYFYNGNSALKAGELK